MARRLAACDRGSAAVEFAILLPVFLAFLLGVVEFGRAMWIRQTLQFAVEEATRYAIANTAAADTLVSQRARERMEAVTSATAVTVTVVNDATGVTVTATHDFAFLVPDLLPFGPLTLSARSHFPR